MFFRPRADRLAEPCAGARRAKSGRRRDPKVRRQEAIREDEESRRQPFRSRSRPRRLSAASFSIHHGHRRRRRFELSALAPAHHQFLCAWRSLHIAFDPGNQVWAPDSERCELRAVSSGEWPCLSHSVSLQAPFPSFIGSENLARPELSIRAQGLSELCAMGAYCSISSLCGAGHPVQRLPLDHADGSSAVESDASSLEPDCPCRTSTLKYGRPAARRRPTGAIDACSSPSSPNSGGTAHQQFVFRSVAQAGPSKTRCAPT